MLSANMGFAGVQSLEFTQPPQLNEIGRTYLTLFWGTNTSAKGTVYYGKTEAYEMGKIEESEFQGFHQVTLSNLWPGTVYHIKVVASSNSETVSSRDWMVITASHRESTGEMHVYFTKSVDTTRALFAPAAGNQKPYLALIDRINQAQHSIDFCAYSLNLSDVANALVKAKQRGVRVRFIYDDGHHQSAVERIKSFGIRVIDDSFGTHNDGKGLQHNKFVIFDARDTTSFSDDWVWTGSYNFTTQATNDNAENAILIQDESLAKIYTMEFNEMWGSVTDTPNADSSRFGQQKTDNTPHEVDVNGIRVEAYFSPGDHVENHIIGAIQSAENNIEFALLSFTRYSIRNALINAKVRQGVTIAGVLDRGEENNSYSQYRYLKSNNIDVLLYGESGTLHHKYMIADGHTDSDPLVETGSYNWTTSAENYNNENIVIVHNAQIADFYWQEFANRYHHSGGRNPLTTGVHERNRSGTRPANFVLTDPFPNPSGLDKNRPVEIWLSQRSTDTRRPTLAIFNVLGQKVWIFKGDFSRPGLYRLTWDKRNMQGERMPEGIYFLRAKVNGTIVTKKIIITH
ncbi:MAG: T9SS type A sorting domain-containing protein [Calditrichaeota bacterium]|nr:T9SS type A sorting domain-containing protein [Calditrichota bacterium]